MYMLAPLGEHSDDGFGAMGDAFFRAAQTLRKTNKDGKAFLDHLPETYLLRHAAELFLKSGIIILHRRLRISYDSQPHTSPPMLMMRSGKWKSIYRTHDLTELYCYWKELIVDHKERIIELSHHQSDMSVPAELDEWIKTLADADPNSDYFRYPVSKNQHADKEKSPFKEVDPESLFSDRKDGEYVKAMLVENSKGELVHTFKYDSETSKEVGQAAWQAADMLSNFHFMIRVELTDGW
jgi:hypothetical protein